MLPQLTYNVKILYLLMVVIVGALCNTEKIYLYSQCAEKFVRVTSDGKVKADVNSDPQTVITIGNAGLNDFRITFFIEDIKSYICFSKKWRLVTSKELQEYCYFYETMVNGYARFASVKDPTKHMGFTKKKGESVKYLNIGGRRHYEKCYNLYIYKVKDYAKLFSSPSIANDDPQIVQDQQFLGDKINNNNNNNNNSNQNTNNINNNSNYQKLPQNKKNEKKANGGGGGGKKKTNGMEKNRKRSMLPRNLDDATSSDLQLQKHQQKKQLKRQQQQQQQLKQLQEQPYLKIRHPRHHRQLESLNFIKNS